ncbi:hypothetical protein K439DRAFT_1408442 [Ramaria rubella]|nr:hypothetical protein K439DRAFT_1408442 [Ramaria rubella]
MMRLLAQLETRLEPGIDAIAEVKEGWCLRVVVQFVKLPYTANTWRTILHLTLDEPIPRGTPQSHRFTNGDTTVLPYSYWLGPAPHAHAPHFTSSGPTSTSTTTTPTTTTASSSSSTTMIQQLYTVPLSPSSPFPILPISLPNVALYLQSAMRDSRARKVQSDVTGGMRRLARMVGACYPEEEAEWEREREERERERRGGGRWGLLRRMVGGGGRGGGGGDGE